MNPYPAAWRAELVAQLAEKALNRPGIDTWFAVAEHIVRDTGCPLPTTDIFVHAWLRDRSRPRWTWVERSAHVLGGGRGANLRERLRNDDFTATLLPLAVARPAVSISEFLRTLVGLVDEGVVDRDALSRRTFADMVRGTPSEEDAAKVLEARPLTPDEHARVIRTRREVAEPFLASLLQDGTREETAHPLTSLRALAPTPAENAPVLRDHVAMLDLSLPVAAYGQEALIGLDEAGLLEPEVVTEASERVLLRSEKKLVRAQLSWLDRVARKDPARAGRVLTEAATAFQNRDAALQERALDVVARHLKTADEEVLPEL